MNRFRIVADSSCDHSRRICVVDKETVHCLGASFIFCQCTSSQEEDVLSIDLNLLCDLD